jgi:hypothetical protein
MDREGRLDAVHPIQGDLLPERDVPEFLIDRVRSPFNGSVSDFAFEPIQNVGRGCGRTVANQGPL